MILLLSRKATSLAWLTWAFFLHLRLVSIMLSRWDITIATILLTVKVHINS